MVADWGSDLATSEETWLDLRGRLSPPVVADAHDEIYLEVLGSTTTPYAPADHVTVRAELIVLQCRSLEKAVPDVAVRLEKAIYSRETFTAGDFYDSCELDRSPQWEALTAACNGDDDYTIILHGDKRQALNIFLDRVRWGVHTGVSAQALEFPFHRLVRVPLRPVGLGVNRSAESWRFAAEQALTSNDLATALAEAKAPTFLLLEAPDGQPIEPDDLGCEDEQEFALNVNALRDFLCVELPRVLSDASKIDPGRPPVRTLLPITYWWIQPTRSQRLLRRPTPRTPLVLCVCAGLGRTPENEALKSNVAGRVGAYLDPRNPPRPRPLVLPQVTHLEVEHIVQFLNHPMRRRAVPEKTREHILRRAAEMLRSGANVQEICDFIDRKLSPKD